MPKQLTTHSTERIVGLLDEGYFSAAAFDISFPEEDKRYADIRFKDNRQFFFAIKKTRYGGEFDVSYSLGPVTMFVKTQEKNFGECCGHLSKWSECIRNELIASSPVYIQFEKFKQGLNDEIERRFTDGSERFSTDDVAELKAKIDELTGKMEELHRRNELTEGELDAIKKSLDALKGDAESIPKKTWYRAAGNKIASLMSRFISSKAGQNLLEEGTKKLLELP